MYPSFCRASGQPLPHLLPETALNGVARIFFTGVTFPLSPNSGRRLHPFSKQTALAMDVTTCPRDKKWLINPSKSIPVKHLRQTSQLITKFYTFCFEIKRSPPPNLKKRHCSCRGKNTPISVVSSVHYNPSCRVCCHSHQYELQMTASSSFLSLLSAINIEFSAISTDITAPIQQVLFTQKRIKSKREKK